MLGAAFLAMLAFVLHHLGDPLEVEFVNREVSELIFTPCFWGPQMVPSNYSPTEARRSALFRFKSPGSAARHGSTKAGLGRVVIRTAGARAEKSAACCNGTLQPKCRHTCCFNAGPRQRVQMVRGQLPRQPLRIQPIILLPAVGVNPRRVHPVRTFPPPPPLPARSWRSSPPCSPPGRSPHRGESPSTSPAIPPAC